VALEGPLHRGPRQLHRPPAVEDVAPLTRGSKKAKKTNKNAPKAGAKAKTLDAARARAILDAATDLFCERGYDGVSMRDVARQADVNKALIFYYYANKAALFEAVLERYYEAQAASFQRAAARDADFGERLHAIIDSYLDFLDQNRHYAKLVQHEVARSSEHLPLISQNLAQLFGLVESALGDRLPKTGPLSAKQFFLTISGMTINYYTYAPAVRSFWGSSPLSAPARAERRGHVHWVVDAILQALERS
jgi:AcrR family transcriptional regulator